MAIAIICSISLLSLLIFFQNQPVNPPSAPEYYRRVNGPAAEKSHLKVYQTSLKKLVKDRSFVLLVVSYGLNGGCFYTISTLINQIVKPSLYGLNLTSSEIDAKIGQMVNELLKNTIF